MIKTYIGTVNVLNDIISEKKADNQLVEKFVNKRYELRNIMFTKAAPYTPLINIDIEKTTIEKNNIIRNCEHKKIKIYVPVFIR
jgi:hypothetical protein